MNSREFDTLIKVIKVLIGVVWVVCVVLALFSRRVSYVPNPVSWPVDSSVSVASLRRSWVALDDTSKEGTSLRLKWVDLDDTAKKDISA